MSETVHFLPIDDLSRRPQVRQVTGFEEGRIAGLAHSLKQVGMLDPIRAYRDGDALVVIDGECRLRAAAIAELELVPVRIVDRPLAPSEVLYQQMIHDLQKASLGPLERGEGIHALMQETGWTAAKAAEQLGISPAHVSKLLKLTRLPDPVREALLDGRIKLSVAYELQRIDDDAQRQQATECALEGATRAQVVDRIRTLKEEQKPTPPRRRKRASRERVVIPLGAGRSVAVTAPSLSIDALVEWLTHLARSLGDAASEGQDLSTALAALPSELEEVAKATLGQD